MRLQILVCVLLAVLVLPGCIYVKVEGRPCRHWGERMEALERCEGDLDECEDEDDEDEDDDSQ